MNSKYLVTAYSTFSVAQGNGDPLEIVRNGYDADSPADTLREAKRRAKHLLSDEYQKLTESEQPMSYVQILKGRDVIVDYWR